MDRIISMATFTKVVECGGFSAAGRRLNMSVAMVSNHVQALEDHLGARLLNRTTRKVSVTEVGKAYYDRCIQILSELDEADQAAGVLQATPRGNLRLNISPALAPLIGHKINEFVTTNPQASVTMIMSDRMVDLIEEGFDLAIRGTPVAESNFIIRRLGSYRFVVCGAPSYFAEHGTPKVPADLAQHNCLNYSYSPFGEDWHFTSESGEESVRISGNFQCNSSEALRNAVLLGQGLIMLPSFLVADDIRAGALIPALENFGTVEFAINAIYPHRHHLSAKVRSFIDLLGNHFSLKK
jgi:DNA-binding transcriptional LysR family regulator